MKTEVITVGTELLSGTFLNTNLGTICLELAEIGMEAAFHTTVGDVQDRMVKVIRTAVKRADAVILTGGLGPTHDDLTREAVSRATGRPLEFHEELEQAIRTAMESRARRMSDVNLNQAYLPRGARAISNRLGTAPGIDLEHDGVRIFALPGVPGEMEAMLRDHVKPALAAAGGGQVVVIRSLKVIGIGESDLAPRIESIVRDCAERGYPEVALLATAGEVSIRLRARSGSQDEAAGQIAPVEEQLRQALGSRIYGAGDDTLEGTVTDMARQRDLTLALAESFTGGALASRLVAVPGASMLLKAGFVTYAIDSKVKEIGVPEELLERHGAVSAETAVAMAEGARDRTGASIGLSTTGEAGPLPQEEPVGTMFIGLAWDGGSAARKLTVPGDRQQIRLWGSQAALDTLRRWMLGESLD